VSLLISDRERDIRADSLSNANRGIAPDQNPRFYPNI